ncbi:unannotated protein [freshwater metagenome]|uniref:Unannotated protein n=1 Tax=freshwater metagenome TaxID=449393 RepID=A0A6J6XWF5_9ZZZZ
MSPARRPVNPDACALTSRIRPSRASTTTAAGRSSRSSRSSSCVCCSSTIEPLRRLAQSLDTRCQAICVEVQNRPVSRPMTTVTTVGGWSCSTYFQVATHSPTVTVPCTTANRVSVGRSGSTRRPAGNATAITNASTPKIQHSPPITKRPRSTLTPPPVTTSPAASAVAPSSDITRTGERSTNNSNTTRLNTRKSRNGSSTTSTCVVPESRESSPRSWRSTSSHSKNVSAVASSRASKRCVARWTRLPVLTYRRKNPATNT